MKSLNEEPGYVIVVGASAGGLNALAEFVSHLDPNLDAAVFVVMHLSRTGISDFLVHRVKQFTALHCTTAVDRGPIQKGHIYIARPNSHLLVKDGRIILGRGPMENRWRPSIDVLFRSAAVNYGGRVIGVVLTGLMDDGVSGMNAIRKSGGICIVQDPNEAEYPDMPLAVLNNMEVDHCVPLSEMGKIIDGIIARDETRQSEIPDVLKAEAEISERVAIGIDIVSDLGEHSAYNCPDCGGGLWLVKEDKIERYRCYTGHSYSERDLAIKQADQVEATLWVALRMMEERRNLLIRMEKETKRKGFARLASEHAARTLDIQQHIDRLKDILFAVQNNAEPEINFPQVILYKCH